MTNTTTIRQDILEDLIDTIITTRDFCGNERDAVFEMCLAHGLPKHLWVKAFRKASFRANARWRQFQRQAGVPEKHIW